VYEGRQAVVSIPVRAADELWDVLRTDEDGVTGHLPPRIAARARGVVDAFRTPFAGASVRDLQDFLLRRPHAAAE
jgi:hypothetical protein